MKVQDDFQISDLEKVLVAGCDERLGAKNLRFEND